MKLPVSVWMGYFSDLTAEQTVDALTAAGFYNTEFSINQVENVLTREGTPQQIGLRLGDYAREKGMNIPQGHLSYKQGLCTKEAVDSLKRELDLFLGIGIRNAVIHANGGGALSEEERFECRVKCLSELADYLKGTDLTLCLENLGSVPETHTVERIFKFINAVDSDRLGICLDTGHLHLVNGRGQATQSQSEFIHGAGKYLCAMHITNNSGMGDDHLMPYSSRVGIDWKEVLRSLQDIQYQGLFNLEILGENKAPMPILLAKLRYIKAMTDYMMSDEFLAE